MIWYQRFLFNLIVGFVTGMVIVGILSQTDEISAASRLAAWLPENNTGGVSAAFETANVTAVDLSRTGVDFNTGSTYNSRNWETGSAVNSSKYLEWGISPTAGYQLDLSSLDIRYDRSGTGPAQLEIRFSVDNFATDALLFTDVAVSDSSEEQAAIDLSGLPIIASGQTGLFRLYGFAASSSAGTFDIEDTVSFDGANGLVIYGNIQREPVAVGGRTFFLDDTWPAWPTLFRRLAAVIGILLITGAGGLLAVVVRFR